MDKETTAEENEAKINDLIELLWPRLDAGESKSDIMADIHNVLDAWEPKDVKAS